MEGLESGELAENLKEEGVLLGTEVTNTKTKVKKEKEGKEDKGCSETRA